MKFIDLSVPLNENTPVYPGDPKTKINSGGLLEKDGYEDHYVCVGTHVGTHIDAPSHMLAGGKSLDQFSISSFTGRGVCIKVDKSFNIDGVKKATLKKGDVVLFNTGMSSVYYRPEYYDKYPAMPEELATYLVKAGVKLVGVDMCSPDYEPFPIHKIFLRNGVLIIENLTNLSALAGKKFTVYAFPIKLELDGVPVRVVAQLI